MKLENGTLSGLVGEVKEIAGKAEIRIKDIDMNIDGINESIDTVKQNITINGDNIEELRVDFNTLNDAYKIEVTELKTLVGHLEEDTEACKIQHEFDERNIEAYLAI